MAKIPRIRPPGSITSGRGWEGGWQGENGKGDKPRNVGENYGKEYDRIFGKKRRRTKTGYQRSRVVAGVTVVEDL